VSERLRRRLLRLTQAVLGDSPALQRADAALAAEHPDASEAGFAEEAARRATAFAGRPPLEPGAALLDWCAW
jgi:hypothetical protein